MHESLQRRTVILWVAGIAIIFSSIVLVLAFVPLKTCPNRWNLEDRKEEPSESAAHLPACPPCGGRGRIPLLQWLRICRVCGGSGIERGWTGFISTPDTKCPWCDGTGKHKLLLR
jgi:hypothetical protein